MTHANARAIRSSVSGSAATDDGDGWSAVTVPDQVVAAQRVPESRRRRDPREDPHQLRVEPAPAPLRHRLERQRRPAGFEKDLGDLREVDDPRLDRDGVVAQAVGIAAAVPVLVHRSDGFGGLAREAHRQRDLRAAIAPDPEQLTAAARPLGREHGELAQAREQAAAPLRVLQRVGHLLGEAPPVAQPHRALHFVIVPAEELVDALRVARAAGVLQEQRVMQVGLLFLGQAERLRDAHADDAGPVGVAVRVPLGEVERMTQPGNDGDQRNPGGGMAQRQHLEPRSGCNNPARRIPSDSGISANDSVPG